MAQTAGIGGFWSSWRLSARCRGQAVLRWRSVAWLLQTTVTSSRISAFGLDRTLDIFKLHVEGVSGCSLVGHLRFRRRALLGITRKFAVRKVVG